eukprot:Polyplicarium_translucidae@DN3297_c0_g2_i2.p3
MRRPPRVHKTRHGDSVQRGVVNGGAGGRAEGKPACATLRQTTLQESQSKTTAEVELTHQMVQALMELQRYYNRCVARRGLLESQRKKLHNTLQEIRGNIRVFCRVRPALSTEMDRELEFQISKDKCEVTIQSDSKPSVTGIHEVTDSHSFAFDRIFGA